MFYLYVYDPASKDRSELSSAEETLYFESHGLLRVTFFAKKYLFIAAKTLNPNIFLLQLKCNM